MSSNNRKHGKQNITTVVAGDNYSLQSTTAMNGSDSGANGYDSEWMNIIALLKAYKGYWSQALVDDNTRMRIQFFVIYMIMGLVSLGMTILNAFTSWELLGYATLGFFILNAINCVLCMISETTERISRLLFAVEAVSLFTFFAIMGNPEGFSILWSLLLPTCGMLLFRSKYGSIVAGIQWLIIIFLLWTEPGKSLLMYDYTSSFLQRFPLLYLAFFFVGFFFEYVRHSTHEELVNARTQFEYLYKHDALTGLYNRYGLNAEIAKAANSGKNECKAFAIADLDHFKRTNDMYGHLIGDEVLKTSAGIIRSIVGADGHVCRWGGEEFSIVFFDETKAEEICRKINRACADHEYNFGGVHFCNTISIGLVVSRGDALPQDSQVITQADENLYTSKTTGRDKVTTTVLRDGGTPQPGKDSRQAS